VESKPQPTKQYGLLHQPSTFNRDRPEYHDTVFDPYPEVDIPEHQKKYSQYNEQMVHQEYKLPQLFQQYIEVLRPIEGHLVRDGDFHIAEIGVGTGLVANAIKGDRSSAVHWDGYDWAPKAVEASLPFYATVTEHDIVQAPLPKQYDVIIMCNVFDKWMLDYQCAGNIYDSLKPGGVLIASFPREFAYWPKSGWEYDWRFDIIDSLQYHKTWKPYTPIGRHQGYHDIKTLQRREAYEVPDDQPYEPVEVPE
jgi:SAM-dependent methyltransferase